MNVKVLSPTSGFPAWDLTKGLETPRESDLESQWDLITGVPQDWAKQTPVLEGTNKILWALRPRGKEQ